MSAEPAQAGLPPAGQGTGAAAPHDADAAEHQARAQLVTCGRDLLHRGLLSQTSGNLSIRLDDRICITPSSMEYDLIESDDIVVLELDGSVRSGTGTPSSETPCTAWFMQPGRMSARSCTPTRHTPPLSPCSACRSRRCTT